MKLYSRLPRPVEWHIRRCGRLEVLLWGIGAGTLVINVLLAILFSMMRTELLGTSFLAGAGATWAGHRRAEWVKILRWEARSGRRSTY